MALTILTAVVSHNLILFKKSEKKLRKVCKNISIDCFVLTTEFIQYFINSVYLDAKMAMSRTRQHRSGIICKNNENWFNKMCSNLNKFSPIFDDVSGKLCAFVLYSRFVSKPSKSNNIGAREL